MPVWPITCGVCGLSVAAEVVYGWPPGLSQDGTEYLKNEGKTLWLRCPNCREGSVKLASNAVHPVAPVSTNVRNLEADVERTWHEARLAHSVGCCTAAEMMCRKILMYLAVDKAKAPAGKRFVEYIDDLDTAGYIIPGLKPTVDQIRKRGNTATHELPHSTEADSLTTIEITRHLLEAAYALQ